MSKRTMQEGREDGIHTMQSGRDWAQIPVRVAVRGNPAAHEGTNMTAT